MFISNNARRVFQISRHCVPPAEASRHCGMILMRSGVRWRWNVASKTVTEMKTRNQRRKLPKLGKRGKMRLPLPLQRACLSFGFFRWQATA